MTDVTKLRGVNLGGWLVLEKWMTPSLFTGVQVQDEYGLCGALGKDAAAILKLHRDNFITERDFKWIADHGLNAVRLPIGHWIFGRSKPYVGGIEYVDQALDWAEQYGLKVILDIHGAPGSQNGKDHSGRIGKIEWHKDDNVLKTLQLVERLVKRYKGVPSLAGIELLNEPSWKLGRKSLVAYYDAGYRLVRKYCGPEVAVIFSDALKPTRWQRVLRGKRYQNLVLDTHRYQLSFWDRRRTVLGALKHCLRGRPRLLARLYRVRPVIVGEWSAALPAVQMRRLSKTQQDLAHRMYVAAQLAVQADVGWFYWSYKTENGGPWSFRDCAKRGWLPDSFKS